MTGPQCTRFQLRVFRVFQHQLPFSEDSLFFHLNKGRLSFQLDTKHRASGKWRAGVCFDNELDINLQFINTDHAMSLELISSFYKAWFSTKHITDFKKKKKIVDTTKAQRVQGRNGTALWKAWIYQRAVATGSSRAMKRPEIIFIFKQR